MRSALRLALTVALYAIGLGGLWIAGCPLEVLRGLVGCTVAFVAFVGAIGALVWTVDRG